MSYYNNKTKRLTACSNMQIRCGIMLTLLLFMLTSTLPIETSGFNIPLIPIDSVILPKNHTPEARHQLMAEISRNRVLNLMALSSARAMNPSERLMKDVPTTIQPPISLALSNYYVTRLGIGSQLYTPYLMVDTGAADTWVQCEGCSNCFPVLGGNFKYNESTSHRSLRCRDPLCVPKLCNSGGVCRYKNQYGGGSTSCTTEGWVSTDTFTFPGTNQTSMKFQVAFGCGIDNQKISFGKNDGPNNPIAGIFGLGMGERSILKQLSKQTNRRFSYCLPSSTTPRVSRTMLSFGMDAKISGSVQKTEILPAGNFQAYFVNLLGISIAEKRLNIDPALFKKHGTGGGFIIDTGSPYSMLVQGAYTTLRNEMVKYMMEHSGKRPTRLGMFDLCYGSLGGENKTLPSMIFHFKGANLVLDSKAVFELFGSNYCMTIFSTSDEGINILGAFQQANHRFLFDVPKKSLFSRKPTVSFAPEVCQ